MTALQGVDYASVDENKAPDFAAARAAGTRFAIVRGAYPTGGRMRTDAHYGRDRDAIRAAGLVLGSYVILDYSGAITPEQQVQTFAAAIGTRLPGDLPVGLDVEFPGGRASTGLSSKQAIAWVDRAYQALRARFGTVMTYTSARVWHEDLDDRTSVCGDGPVWLKTPYAYKAGNPPHPERQGELGKLPVPWRGTSSPGAWIQQYQGDARPVPGFSSTVDLNAFLAMRPGETSDRVRWVQLQLRAESGWHTGSVDGLTYGPSTVDAVKMLQTAHGLEADGVIGPVTFAFLAK